MTLSLIFRGYRPLRFTAASWALIVRVFSAAEHSTQKMEENDRDGNYNNRLQVKIMSTGLENTRKLYSSAYIYDTVLNILIFDVEKSVEFFKGSSY